MGGLGWNWWKMYQVKIISNIMLFLTENYIFYSTNYERNFENLNL